VVEEFGFLREEYRLKISRAGNRKAAYEDVISDECLLSAKVCILVPAKQRREFSAFSVSTAITFRLSSRCAVAANDVYRFLVLSKIVTPLETRR
jgi:hypothetical protein